MSQSRRARLPSPSRLWVVATIVVAVLLGGWYVWRQRAAAATEGGFRTEEVQRGNIRVTISSTGTLSAISTVTVGSQISGQVTEVLVDFNSKVSKGDVLARIDPSTYRAQLEQGDAAIASARAQLAQAQASLRNARLDFQRKQDLVQQKLIARSDFDLSRAALAQAEAQVKAAQAQIRQQSAAVKNTQVNISRAVIRSPVDGVVLTRKIEPGQTVAANFSAPELFTIAEDLSKMQIELSVDESDIGQVRVGQTVHFTADAFPERQFKGVVKQVRLAAATTNNVVTYPVIVTVDNGDGTLLPGLTVNAEIEVSKRSDVLKLGNAALRFRPGDDSPLADLQPDGAAPQGMRGAGMQMDWSGMTAGLNLQPGQKAAFDAAVKALQQKQEERRARWQQESRSQQGGNRLFGGGRGRRFDGGSPDPRMLAQIRARMRDRVNQQFSSFVATLDEAQRGEWAAALDAQLNAKRVTVYRLRNGKPEAVSVEIGASDGSSTEVMGSALQPGDRIISGERAPTGTS